MSEVFFLYGNKETDYLKSRDKRLAEVIDRVGHIHRAVDGDLAIQRGLRMVYHHREVTPHLFEKYRRRFSPYGSVASLYLWAVAGGAIPEMKDYQPKKK